jgi:hypothetical protein
MGTEQRARIGSGGDSARQGQKAQAPCGQKDIDNSVQSNLKVNKLYKIGVDNSQTP